MSKTVTADGWLSAEALKCGAEEKAQLKGTSLSLRALRRPGRPRYEVNLERGSRIVQQEHSDNLRIARQHFENIQLEQELLRTPAAKLWNQYITDQVNSEEPGRYTASLDEDAEADTAVDAAALRRQEDDIIEEARRILAGRFQRGATMDRPEAVADYLKLHLAYAEREVFGVILLDNRHRVLRHEDLFFGTIDAASVYPREVVKTALAHNAAALVMYHNHPSGEPEPSQADRQITVRLKTACEAVGVRVLDHLVIGGVEHVSFSQRNLL